MNVQDSTVLAVLGAPNWPELQAEYVAEAAIPGMPTPAGKMDDYRTLEAAGLLHWLSATVEDQVVGFISVLVGPSPRYDEPVAISESFFVARAWRGTGAGLRLLRAAEAKARALGSRGLLVSAPYGGSLFQVLPRVGYTETNRIFFKRVTDD